MTGKRILHMVPAGPFGGAQRLVMDLAVAQAAAGDRPAVLFLDRDDLAPALARERGLAVLRPLASPMPVLRKISAVRAAVAGHPADLWHIHLPRPWLGLALPREGAARQVIHLHCEPPLTRDRPSLRLLLDRFALGRMVARADHLIAVSQWIADGYRSAFPRAKTAVSVVLNGTALPPTRPPRAPAPAPVFGMASRLAPHKGLEEFLALAAAIRSRLSAARFRIAGEGDPAYLAVLRRHAAQLAIGDAVEFVGFVARVEDFWAGLDMALFTAPFEPFGLRLIEPLAHGVPAASYFNGSGSDEIMRLCRGIVGADYGQADELGARIAEVFATPARAARLGEQGRRDVEAHFTVEHMRAGVGRAYARAEAAA